MALLHQNVLNLVLFVGFRRCFLYPALIILSSHSYFLFNHATVGLCLVSEDILGMVFSAACNMVLTRQLCACSIVFWFCTFVVIVIFLKLRPICSSYAPALLFHGGFPFLFYDYGEIITSPEFIFFASFQFRGYHQTGNCQVYC